MQDISANERRLIAALDRLDHAVERGGQRLSRLQARADARPGFVAPPSAAPADAGPLAPDEPAQPALAQRPASAELSALHDRQNAALEAMRARLAETHERLAASGEQAARLAAANDALVAANRQLIEAAEDWAGRGESAVRDALEAEVRSLHAARAAEIAQMGEIMDALDRMLGVETKPRGGPAGASLKPASDGRATDGGAKGPSAAGGAAAGDRGAGAADERRPGVAAAGAAADHLPSGSRHAAPVPAPNAPVAAEAARPAAAANPAATPPTAEASPDPARVKAHSATVRPGRPGGRADAAPPESPARELTIERDPAGGSLFGGVYGDDPDDLPADQEDR